MNIFMEGKRPWWGGRASNPVGGAMRRRVGSTPASFRPFLGITCVFALFETCSQKDDP